MIITKVMIMRAVFDWGGGIYYVSGTVRGTSHITRHSIIISILQMKKLKLRLNVLLKVR